MSPSPPPRIPLATARQAAARLMGALAREPLIVRMAVTGALRRMEPRVAEIEILLTTLEAEALGSGAVEQQIQDLAFVEGSAADGDLRLEGAIPLRVTVLAEDPEAFVAAQVARTATRAHHEAVAAAAQPAGSAPTPCFTEEDWYRARGLPPLPPELRGSARLDAPPEALVQAQDLRGLFGLHSEGDGGRHPVATLAERAGREGYRWAVFLVGGEEACQLDARRAEVAAAPLRTFFAVGADVAPGGSLDLDPDRAESADLVVLRPGASPTDTARALSHPRVKVLGHAHTGGVWSESPWAEPDWRHVIRSAADHNVALEFSGAATASARPGLLHALAQECGVAAMPSAGARDLRGLDDVLCAVGDLRRNRWTQESVLAARSAEEFDAWLTGRTR